MRAQPLLSVVNPGNLLRNLVPALILDFALPPLTYLSLTHYVPESAELYRTGIRWHLPVYQYSSWPYPSQISRCHRSSDSYGAGFERVGKLFAWRSPTSHNAKRDTYYWRGRTCLSAVALLRPATHVLHCSSTRDRQRSSTTGKVQRSSNLFPLSFPSGNTPLGNWMVWTSSATGHTYADAITRTTACHLLALHLYHRCHGGFDASLSSLLHFSIQFLSYK